MEPIEIIFGTIAIIAIIEGMFLSVFPGQIKKALRQIFKNKKKIITIGMIEIIIGLTILFIISL